MQNQQDQSFNENSNNYTIAIQPIVDSNLQHVADELLYRSSDACNSAHIDDDVQATARACAVAVYEIGLENLCGSRQLFINASYGWLTNPNLQGLPSQQIVIEVLENTPVNQEVLTSLQSLKQQGYTIALDDFILDKNNEKLLPYCDIVKIDISNPIQKEVIKKLVSQGFTLLAERVETQHEFELCQSLGFTLFQGYFYEKPKTQASGSIRRTASRANQLQLLACLYSENASLANIGSLITRDPYLLSAVFKRANSAEKGAGKPTTKLINCLQMIGLKELRTLVSILMLASNSPASRLNLIKALTRAFACEIVAEQRHIDEQESFITGLFSLMPSILEIDLKAVLKEIHLGKKIENALKKQAGPLGELLRDIKIAETSTMPNDFPANTMLRAAAQARALIDTHASTT
ncbi:MAG: EAL and HDOD domain-containing protein [Halomonadaceae bacterium]|uniref:EAL domain-containing protein n=1 Tax=Halomonas colorata TaxID=2742615 RepID=A0ABR9FXI1_9GAMM|nr:EAL domain-containing protein [Halomonas colorata]MBE0463359.1 EAL domain-containing protein [Halomonas colorata]